METTTAPRGGTGAGVVLAVVALVVAVAGVVLGVTDDGDGDGDADRAAELVAAIDADAYHAVTMTNGAVYYARVSADGGVLVLDDVHYLSGATGDNPSGNLVKRGAEIHAPDGPMVLNPDNVEQIEPVGGDSVIARGIERIASGDDG